MTPLRCSVTSAALLAAAFMAGQAEAARRVTTPTPAAAPATQATILPRDTQVVIEFLTTLSSATNHAGDHFAFRLAAPVVVKGAVVIPEGAQGMGEVVEAKPASGSGVPGVLILRPHSIEVGGQPIPLYRLQQGEVGQDRVGRQNNSVWTGKYSVLPTSLLAMSQTGGNVMVPQGGRALALVARDVEVAPPLASAAPPSAPRAFTPLPEGAELSVPAPPAGKAQVVFFRPASLSWMAIGCTVSEDGRKVSSLGSGKWFAMLLDPGIHAFKVSGETSDSLRLNVEEGDTQFVACRMRASILIARPFIRPVASRIFHSELPELRPVSDDGMADPNVLRRDQLRYALAERGDVRGPLASGASRGDTTGVRALDKPTQGVLGATASVLAREVGVP